jgi:hypothetical protein
VRNVAISLVSMMALSCLLYLVGRWMIGDDAIAKTLAGLPLIAVKNVYELLETRRAKAEIRRQHNDAIPMLANYAVPWLSLALQGALVIMGAAWVSTGVSGFSIGFAAGATGQGQLLINKAFLVTASAPLWLVGIYFSGRWIGARSGRLGYTSLLLATAIAVVVLQEIDLEFLNEQELRQFYELNDISRDWSGFGWRMLWSFKGFLLAALVASSGFYFGRRRRMTRYFAFILRVLPEETRATLLSIAHEEARGIVARQTA